jgi:prepilin signal peptidase PulO-like enzyme (type II secretory pathway)
LGVMNPFPRLLEYVGSYLGLGVVIALIWVAIRCPFGRHVLMALSVMTFATLLLPDEMMFFARHPVLAFAVLFTAGFAGAHLGRSIIGTVATGIVLGVLGAAIYRAVFEVS